MHSDSANFIENIRENLNKLKNHKKIVSFLDCDEKIITIISDSINLLIEIESLIEKDNIRINYLNQIQNVIVGLPDSLPYFGYDLGNFIKEIDNINIDRNTIKDAYNNSFISISRSFQHLQFSINFFKKINFFKDNIVVVGANGSGKTKLSYKFEQHLIENGVLISAQRILFSNSFNNIPSRSLTTNQLKKIQTTNRTIQNTNDLTKMSQAFGISLQNILADNLHYGYSYRKKSLEKSKKGEKLSKPKTTNLDKCIKIWNSLIGNRMIDSEDGMNLIVKSNEFPPYSIMQLSEGEKVMLFLITQVLQAPENGFIIIDEPEMHLHKTIVNKLWDVLEKERKDCLFIYLTHDLDFASSRKTAKKIWVKSFTFPFKWEIEIIHAEELPETLLLELLGSKKNILFCEGEKGSIDEKVFSILFSNLTVMPVGGCSEVINYTKAFNKLPNSNTEAFGLIDSDHHEKERLKKIKEFNIFSFELAEVENLFLDIDFLEKLADNIMVSKNKVELIKLDIIEELEKLKEVQTSNYVSTKINYYFTDSNVTKGNSLKGLKNNYQDFLNRISIDKWYEKRISELQEKIDSKDYESILKVFNNKGIKKIANRHLNISNFTHRSIQLLQNNRDAQLILYKYFPKELIEIGK